MGQPEIKIRFSRSPSNHDLRLRCSLQSAHPIWHGQVRIGEIQITELRILSTQQNIKPPVVLFSSTPAYYLQESSFKLITASINLSNLFSSSLCVRKMEPKCGLQATLSSCLTARSSSFHSLMMALSSALSLWIRGRRVPSYQLPHSQASGVPTPTCADCPRSYVEAWSTS